jgi:hypothetical protein
MGGFGNIARTLGSAGNEVMAAQTGLQDLNQKLVETKVKNLMDQLKIQQTQQQINKGETDPLEQQVAAMEKILGRKLTEQEKGTVLGLAPAATGIDKASLRAELLGLANEDKATPIERRVYTSLLQDIDAGGDLKEIMGKKQAFQSSRAEVSPGEGKPVVETFNNQRWQFDPGKNISGKRDATGQYVLLGTAKEDVGGAPSSLDALIYDIAAGKANLPAGKLGAQVAARAKQLNVDLPNVRTLATTEAQKAASDVSAAFRNWQARQQALSKVSWFTSPFEHAAAKQAADAALQDLQSKSQTAIEAFGKANVPVPQWLSNYAGTTVPANVPPPPTGYTLDPASGRP